MNNSPLKRRLSEFGCYAVAAILIFIFLLPIYYILTMSLKLEVDAFAYPPKWLFIPTLKNYVAIFTDGNFTRYLMNSLIVSSCCVLLGIVVGTPAAYALSRTKNRLIPGLMFFILAVRLIPPMSLLLPIFSLYVKTNLMDTLAGLVLLNLTFVIPLNVWMLKYFFDDVPKEMEESAEIDGCGTLQTFLRVAMPLVAPATAATAIFSWIQAWNEFLFALVVTRLNARTITVAVTNYMNFEEMNWGKIAATAVVISFPVILFSIAVRKYLVGGMTAGAVKG